MVPDRPTCSGGRSSRIAPASSRSRSRRRLVGPNGPRGRASLASSFRRGGRGAALRARGSSAFRRLDGDGANWEVRPPVDVREAGAAVVPDRPACSGGRSSRIAPASSRSRSRRCPVGPNGPRGRASLAGSFRRGGRGAALRARGSSAFRRLDGDGANWEVRPPVDVREAGAAAPDRPACSGGRSSRIAPASSRSRSRRCPVGPNGPRGRASLASSFRRGDRVRPCGRAGPRLPSPGTATGAKLGSSPSVGCSGEPAAAVVPESAGFSRRAKTSRIARGFVEKPVPAVPGGNRTGPRGGSSPLRVRFRCGVCGCGLAVRGSLGRSATGRRRGELGSSPSGAGRGGGGGPPVGPPMRIPESGRFGGQKERKEGRKKSLA